MDSDPDAAMDEEGGRAAGGDDDSSSVVSSDVESINMDQVRWCRVQSLPAGVFGVGWGSGGVTVTTAAAWSAAMLCRLIWIRCVSAGFRAFQQGLKCLGGVVTVVTAGCSSVVSSDGDRVRCFQGSGPTSRVRIA